MQEYGSVAPDLCHHGIKGMKWGVRRYQNKDGSLTPAGLTRYGRTRYSGHIDQDGHAHLHDDVPQPRNMESLTNDEIRARIEQLRSEQDYQNAKRRSSGVANVAATIAAGVSFIGSVIKALTDSRGAHDNSSHFVAKGKQLFDPKDTRLT